MNLPGFCTCDTPAPALREGVRLCDVCGFAIADPLLVRVLAEVHALRRQLVQLERRLAAEQPTPEWLTVKEVAVRLGRSVDFIYAHADDLGARRIGNGPKPRLVFPAGVLEEWL